MKTTSHKYIIECTSALFVLLFVYSAMSKLLDHQNFQAQLQFIVQNTLLAVVLSYGLPLAEIVIAVLLCINTSRLLGLYSFVSLLSFFTAYIIYLLISKRALPCSCGGVISALSWKQHLIFNAGFLLTGIATILLFNSKPQEKQLTQTRTSF